MVILVGVYKIKIGDKIYIGSSNNINGRIKRHIYDLEKNKHYNHKMQNAYNLYLKVDTEIVEIEGSASDDQGVEKQECKVISNLDGSRTCERDE